MTMTATDTLAPTLAPHASMEFNASFWYELQFLARELAHVLGDELLAVVLGGGFGRGEGCITVVDGHEMPYNDVDLFLITKSQTPRGLEKLQTLSHRYEHRMKIAVDFSRPQTLAMVRRWAPLLMWQELLAGHQVLYGPEDILSANISQTVLATLPLVEASRLLLNRGAGLLWAARVMRRLDEAPDDSFTVRNYFKCAQALADATLIAHHVYHSDPAVKAQRLCEIVMSDSSTASVDVQNHLANAYQFRRAPDATYNLADSDLTSMAADWCRIFLWLESGRLQRSFSNISDYAAWSGRREPGQDAPLQRIVANLRRGRVGWRHPREKVYHTLPVALNDLATLRPDFNTRSRPALRQWQEAQ